MANNVNLQDSFLNQVRKENIDVEVMLLNGATLKGSVRGFDNFTVTLQIENMQHLIYKHAIAQIISPRPARAPQPEGHPGAGHPGGGGHPKRSPRPQRSQRKPEEKPEAKFNALDLSQIKLPQDPKPVEKSAEPTKPEPKPSEPKPEVTPAEPTPEEQQ